MYFAYEGRNQVIALASVGGAGLYSVPLRPSGVGTGTPSTIVICGLVVKMYASFAGCPKNTLVSADMYCTGIPISFSHVATVAVRRANSLVGSTADVSPADRAALVSAASAAAVAPNRSAICCGLRYFRKDGLAGSLTSRARLLSPAVSNGSPTKKVMGVDGSGAICAGGASP